MPLLYKSAALAFCSLAVVAALTGCEKKSTAPTVTEASAPVADVPASLWPKLDFAVKKDIKLVVCENTMKQKKIVKSQLLPFVSTVPMAIAEIVVKQEQGWTYLKAGL